jgi:hypothetical protein
VQLAVESVRALLPQVQQIAPEQADPIMQAVSQLQMAFVQASGGAQGAPSGAPGTPGGPQTPQAPVGDAPAPAPAAEPPSNDPGGAGPAQQSGRLWIPGQ